MKKSYDILKQYKLEKVLAMPNDNNMITYITDSHDDYYIAKIIKNRIDNQKDIHCKRISLLEDKRGWEDFIAEITKDGNNKIYYFNMSYTGYVINFENDNYFYWSNDSSTYCLTIYGDKDWIEEIAKISLKYLKSYDYYLKWYHSKDGDSIEVPLHDVNQPIDEMYPWLKEKKLTDFYEEYLNDDASVLLLLGPPGTGKTTFLKGLITHAKESALISYNNEILSDDGIFANFISGNNRFMILEDCDTFLNSRDSGNTMMHRFLNVSDGLVSSRKKKLIFTTNLPSINDVDEALLRSGRCFDVINFDYLTNEQATVLAKKINKPLEEDKDQYSIADIFKGKQKILSSQRSRKVGFV